MKGAERYRPCMVYHSSNLPHVPYMTTEEIDMLVDQVNASVGLTFRYQNGLCMQLHCLAT